MVWITRDLTLSSTPPPSPLTGWVSRGVGEAALARAHLPRQIPGILAQMGWHTQREFPPLPPVQIEPGRSLLRQELRPHPQAVTGEILAAVGWSKGWVCRRCGSRDLLRERCSCGPFCLICPDCSTLGASKTCQELIRAPLPTTFSAYHGLSLPHQLTPAQSRAAQRILPWLSQGGEGLLVAACGAGKTEVAWTVMAQILSQGGRVLMAIPRREVVLELAARARPAFPGLEIQALYGGAPASEVSGQLVIATTHQVLRFYQAFDLVVLDESDAFPYRGCRALAWGVQMARKPQGFHLGMTATPSIKERNVAQRQGRYISIPARFHGHPLPVPELKCSLWPGLGGLPRLGPMKGWFGNPTLLFVPWIRSVEPVRAWLVQQGIPALGAHSQDPKREEKVQALRQGQIQVLVTTTIMERGVTIPKVDVLVLGAEHQGIFTTESLVQMAGRVGRKADSPSGRVLFYGRKISQAMRQARKEIQLLNREAARAGLLKEGYP